LTDTCPGCHGTGKITVDCPYCRSTESFEHEDLSSEVCLCCHNEGNIEDVCPICEGAGKILEKDYQAKV